MNEITLRMNSFIQAHPFNSGDNDYDTVMDQLYQAYTESHEHDPVEIGDAFKELAVLTNTKSFLTGCDTTHI